MSARRGPAVLVIGGGVNGLAAAAYCARAGLAAAVLEARDAAAPLVHNLYALDPALVRELKLSRHGLAFAARDLALTGLTGEGRPLTLTRQRLATARTLATWSKADGEAWPREHERLLALARKLRRLWWEDRPLTDELAKDIAPYAAMSAAALLDTAFETETLKCALAFDATAGGRSVLDAGSALALLWRMAQEMCGLQSAVALPKGGMAALQRAMVEAARAAGAEIRNGARAVRILSHAGAVNGVELADGEIVPAGFVLSTLSRRGTGALLGTAGSGFAATAAMERAPPRAAAAALTLSLRELPPLNFANAPSRFIVAERFESYVSAHAAAIAGTLGADLPMEVTLSDGEAPALHALIRPVPRAPEGGWKTLKMTLVERALLSLARHIPGLPARIQGARLLTPDDIAARCGYDDDLPLPLLQGFGARMQTPVNGLYLCGASAEPVASLSGRAARLAALHVVEEAKA